MKIHRSKCHDLVELATILIVLFGLKPGSCSKFGDKIYKTIGSYQPCVLLTNATHQVGCTSKINGNIGVVHVIREEQHLEWLIKNGQHSPYIPLLSAAMFTEDIMSRLMKSGKISGALVAHISTSTKPDEFSPDTTCPEDKFGLYFEEEEYRSCKQVTWNPLGNGMSFVYYGVPIFALTNVEEVAAIEECFNKHNNGTNARYPLCAVQIKDFMFAAKDTPTCRRKTEMANPIQSTYCDPLGDYNIMGTLFPVVKQLEPDEVIVVAARLDSAGFFHDLSYGANSEVTGITALLAAAYALGDYKRKTDASLVPPLKPIVFMLLNGEVWDYIGSSKVVYDMLQGKFPHNSKLANSSVPVDEAYVSSMNLSNIGYFLEVSQVGLNENWTVWLHSDPISQKDSTVRLKTDNLIQVLLAAAADEELDLQVVPREHEQPLPPASFQRFLRGRHNIPGIVLADHEKQFANKFYHSRFDDPSNIGIKLDSVNGSHAKVRGHQLVHLTKVATALANAVYRLASGGKPPAQNITVPTNMTANLLYCLLYSANCPGFKEGLSSAMVQQLKDVKQPFSRYVSVMQITNHITTVLHSILGFYLGDWLNETVCDSRKKTILPQAVSYSKVLGRGNTICLRSTAYMTVALSPAFELKQYDSTAFSTWAESMWNSDMGIQLFLMADPTVEGLILGAGMLLTLVAFALTYYIYSRSSYLFTPDIMILSDG